SGRSKTTPKPRPASGRSRDGGASTRSPARNGCQGHSCFLGPSKPKGSRGLDESGDGRDGGIAVPSAAVQAAPGRLLVSSAPLLEEERDTLPRAGGSDLAHPGRVHRPAAWPGLAAHDGPVDIPQIDRTDAGDQRLERYEAHGRRSLPQQ